MKKKEKRQRKIDQLKEQFLQAKAVSDSDDRSLAIWAFMDYFGKWKILVTVLAIFGFALGIFVVVDRVFFHESPPEPPKPYMHKFTADLVGFKKPGKVLRINTPELRALIQEAIESGYVSNNFDLDPMKDEGLYLMKYDNLSLNTTVRKSNINKMTLVPLDEPELGEEPLLTLDAMAYFGPRALQTIQTQTMLELLTEAENIRGKKYLELGGALNLNSDGTSVPYRKEGLSEDFGIILPIDEGLPYLKAQVDINHPNADELLKEYQENNKG